MRTSSVLLITAAALIGATPASAATPVLGPADGVQATRTDTTLVVAFTGDPAKWTPLVGRAIAASCGRTPDVTRLQFVEDVSGGAIGMDAGPEKVGADGTLRYTLPKKQQFDFCWLNGSKKDGDAVELAEAAVTPNGAAWLDESRRAQTLHKLVDRATGPGGYRPLATLGAGIVALTGPDGAPGPGETGYWTDGKRATVATLSAAGRRLVIEDLGQEMLRTNVLEQSDVSSSQFGDMAVFFSALGDFIEPDDAKKQSPYRGRLPLVWRDGLRVGVAGRHVRIHFTGRSAATFRKLARRRIKAVCVTRPAPSLFPPPLDRVPVSRATARVPRAGDAIALTLGGRPRDLCVVLDRGTRVALVGITAVGRRWLQDLAALRLMSDTSTDQFAASGASSYRPTATVLAHAKQDRVAMSGPDGRVAVGRVGVWTDGARSAAQATTSASGWRPSVVDEGDGMLRTNVLGRFDLWTTLISAPNDESESAATTATS